MQGKDDWYGQLSVDVRDFLGMVAHRVIIGIQSLFRTYHHSSVGKFAEAVDIQILLVKMYEPELLGFWVKDERAYIIHANPYTSTPVALKNEYLGDGTRQIWQDVPRFDHLPILAAEKHGACTCPDIVLKVGVQSPCAEQWRLSGAIPFFFRFGDHAERQGYVTYHIHTTSVIGNPHIAV